MKVAIVMSKRMFLFGGFALGVRPLLPLAQALQAMGWQVVLQDLPDIVPDARFADGWQARYRACKTDVVAGWSLGGQVAGYLAHHVSCRLMTVASNPRFCAADDWPAGMAVADFADFVARQRQAPADNWRQFVRLCAYGERDAALQRQVKVWQAAWDETLAAQQARFLLHLNWLRDWNTLPVLQAHTAAQCHILAGNDALMDAAAVQLALPQRENVAVKWIDGASHLLVYSRPQDVAAQVDGWYGRNITVRITEIK